MNKDYLRLLLMGKKKLYKVSEIKSIQVPHYDEISVKSLWPHVCDDESFMMYMPHKLPKNR